MNAIKRELANGRGVYIGYKADVAQPGAARDTTYMNRDNWAQYTFTNPGMDHAVCLVGWDDDYAASNFTHTGAYRTDANGNPIKDADGNPIMLSDDESQRLTTPPGNGAWIVKNSWGSETDQQVDDLGNVTGMGNYGVRNAEGKATGYFYLSYYDKTIAAVVDQPLQGMLDLRQRSGGKAEQALAQLNELSDDIARNLALRHTDGMLDQRDGEGLGAVAQQLHITTFGGEETLRHLLLSGPRTQQVATLMLDLVEPRLAVP
jgi:hypothetical protein